MDLSSLDVCENIHGGESTRWLPHTYKRAEWENSLDVTHVRGKQGRAEVRPDSRDSFIEHPNNTDDPGETKSHYADYMAQNLQE